MEKRERLLWAVAILAVDVLIFFLPVLAIVAAYVILVRPSWFRAWVTELYSCI